MRSAFGTMEQYPNGSEVSDVAVAVWEKWRVRRPAYICIITFSEYMHMAFMIDGLWTVACGYIS